MKLIFLDIDGVLNCEDAYLAGECKYIHWKGSEDKRDRHMSFYSKSKLLLNRLIVETEAKIVISSTWRHSGLEHMQRIWQEEEMAGEIIGLTPHLFLKGYNDSFPRGVEIKKWLSDAGFRHINWSKEKQLEYMKESDIENYIIIDDDSDMLYQQRNHFVHVLPSPRNTSGFNEQYYKEALNKLSKTVIELNF